MKKITLSIMLFLSLAMMAQTATDGDYRSVQTGNWSDVNTWQVRAGGAWATPATEPNATNNVYMQPGFTVAVDVASASCNDLQANTTGVLTIGVNTMNVNGKMRGYTGTAVTSATDDVFYSSQANAGTLNNTMITTTNPGVLKIVGTSRTFMNTSEWLASGMTSCSIEFALNSGATVIVIPSFKFRSVVISSGKVDCASTARIGADDNLGTGFLTIKNGATLVSARSGLTSQVISAQSASACGAVTIEAGATLELTGTTPAIDATAIINNGTVIYSKAGSQTLLQKGSGVGSVDIPSYSSLILSASNSKTPPVAITVSTLLQFNGTATIVPTAVNTLTMLNGSTVDRSVTSGTSLPSTAGAVLYGTTSTDLVHLTIGASISNSNELPAAPTPGKVGTLTIKPGVTYTITGGRAVTDVVNNNLIVLLPTTTLTFTINGNISGAGTITGHSSASISFTGANNGDGGTLNLTAGSQVANNFTVNRTGTGAFITLGTPILLNGTTTGSLNLTAGTLKGGSNVITVSGNLQGTNQGIYTATAGGKIVMTGNAGVATISSPTIANLELNDADGFNLTGSPLITGTITLTNGILTTSSTNLLTLSNTATVVGGSNTSYVSGPMVMNTNAVATYTFPVGKSGVYRPFSVNASTTNNNSYTGEYFNTDPHVISSTYINPVTGIADNEYYDIAHSAGSDPATITLTLNGAVTGGTASDFIVVSHYNSGTPGWEDAGGSLAGNSTSGSITSNSLTSFSPFSFGLKPGGTLPLHLISFDAENSNGLVKLKWKASDEIDVNKYVVEESINGNLFVETGTINAKNTGGVNLYSFSRPVAINSNYYFRIKILNNNGKIEYSNIILVKLVTRQVTIYPNPVTNTLILSGLNSGGTIKIVNMTGQIVLQQNTTANSLSVDVSALKTGMHVIQISGENESIINKIFIKE
ncbi:MAG: T9SS type A sorting domain-containing protein [Chitinophagaceae bacterium]